MKQLTESLDELRGKIDAIDLQILGLANERAKLAIEVGQVKHNAGLHDDYYRPEREIRILRNMVELNRGPLLPEQVSSIFRPILTACLSLQKPITVAYLGPQGTFSQEAVFKQFGIDTLTLPVSSIEQISREIIAGNAHYGVVPIENSTTGIINATLDAMLLLPVKICAEVILPIHHHFLRHKDASSHIKNIYAHEQTLAQCQKWLKVNFPDIECIAVGSNGVGAQHAANNPEDAAIASDLCAEIYDLQKVYSNIEDNPQNTTRFWVLGKQKVLPSGCDKTSLMITTPHMPGALIDLLKPLADNNINITMIESRPYQHLKWSYLFFIDIDGHHDDLPVKKAFEVLTEKSVLLTVLGSYPQALK